MLGFGRSRRRLELLNLDGDRRQVGIALVFQQAALIGAVPLGLGGELQPLEQRAS